MKFKQHKDSLTEAQIGQPISMVIISANLISTVGQTMFDGNAITAGPGGLQITST